MNLARIEEVIDHYGRDESQLLPVLEGTQKVLGYLSREAMQHIAEALGVPLSKVYGVATFYSLLATAPKGKHIIRICESAPCHLGGANEIAAALEEQLNIKPGQTTEDGMFTLESTSCLGVCDMAPAMMVDEVVYGNLTPDKVREILADLRRDPETTGE